MTALLLHPHPKFDHAQLIAERLQRNEHINHDTYIVDPHWTFADCAWCDSDPGPAVLAWTWERPDATSNGSAESCVNLECARAVLGSAFDDGAYPEDITVEHPILTGPENDRPWDSAAADLVWEVAA